LQAKKQQQQFLNETWELPEMFFGSCKDIPMTILYVGMKIQRVNKAFSTQHGYSTSTVAVFLPFDFSFPGNGSKVEATLC
jgi:hypothetical protein